MHRQRRRRHRTGPARQSFGTRRSRDDEGDIRAGDDRRGSPGNHRRDGIEDQSPAGTRDTGLSMAPQVDERSPRLAHYDLHNAMNASGRLPLDVSSGRDQPVSGHRRQSAPQADVVRTANDGTPNAHDRSCLGASIVPGIPRIDVGGTRRVVQIAHRSQPSS